MKSLILLPHPFRRIGVVIFAIAATVGIVMTPDGYNGWPSYLLPADTESPLFAALASEGMTHLLNNIAIIGLCVGSIFIACSRERIEDEMTGAVRLNALLTALYVGGKRNQRYEHESPDPLYNNRTLPCRHNP